MKKLSKPVKQIPRETIGIDLGDKMSRYWVVNREGEVVEEGSSHTGYDELLMVGFARVDARDTVREAVDRVLDSWRKQP